VIELFLYTLGAYILLGVLSFAGMLELEIIKRNKLAKQQSKGWSLNERD
jgi:hypothetical protein